MPSDDSVALIVSLKLAGFTICVFTYVDHRRRSCEDSGSGPLQNFGHGVLRGLDLNENSTKNLKIFRNHHYQRPAEKLKMHQKQRWPQLQLWGLQRSPRPLTRFQETRGPLREGKGREGVIVVVVVDA